MDEPALANALLARVIDGNTLIFERTVTQPPERVWRAIADERELTEWMRYPISFQAKVGSSVSFFGEDGIQGHVFIADPPRTLAFSFWSPSSTEEEMKTDWVVRWDLEPLGAGCRITFQHRLLGGAHLWGLGEGWHGFLEQLLAYLDGQLGKLLETRPATGAGDDTALSNEYRAHVSRQLDAWADETADAARTAVRSGNAEQALRAIDRLQLSTKQLYEIARQTGSRPDYVPDTSA